MSIKKEDRVILVVEDEIPLQNAIKMKLERSGFVVLTARSVSQAINHLKDVEGIKIIWLDHYLLGKEDGLDFIATLKAKDSKWRKLPVFVVSNTASEDNVGSYLRLGADKFYTKSDYRLDTIIEDINIYFDKADK